MDSYLIMIFSKISVFLAQNPEFFSTLTVYGPLGAFAGYMVIRGERLAEQVIAENKAMGQTISIMARAVLINVISTDGVGSKTKTIAQEALAEIKAKEG